MLKTSITSLATVCTICATLALPAISTAHESENRVEIEMETPTNLGPGKAVVEFQLVDTKESRVLTPSDLNVTHEKKLHLFTYDSALKEFQHVHPEFDGKVWTVEVSYQVSGDYFLWTQGELGSDSEEFTSFVKLHVDGGLPAWPSPPSLSDQRVGAVNGSVATLSPGLLRAGRMAMLTLTFTREDGSPAQITPYLGAFAHIVATPDDGDSLIHTHPMNGSKPNEGMIHATFPRAGFYRIWVQFVDGGTLKTIPLSVEVLE